MKFHFDESTRVNEDDSIRADETWTYQKAQVGDSVEGLLVKIRRNVGPNKSNVYTIEDEDGKLIDVWGCTVLDTHLSDLEPRKYGVKLAYEGEKTPQSGGRAYHSFEVHQVEATDEVEE